MCLTFIGFLMLKKIIAAAAFATMAASSYAATPGSYYVGGDLGVTGPGDLKSTHSSFGGFVGYNFNENFAIEGGYRSLLSYNNGFVNTRLNQTALSAVGTLPLKNGFSVFGRLGYNRLDGKTDYVGFGTSSKGAVTRPLIGIGVGYDFGNNISTRLEAQRPTGDMTNVSASLKYSF